MSRNGLYKQGRRRWRDGPRWAWLCKIFGHQQECWKWGAWYGLSAMWHYCGSTGYEVDWYCERCGEAQYFTEERRQRYAGRN